MATIYVWDPIEDNVIQEKDENGDVLVDYTTRPTLYGAVLSQDRGGQVRHYHYDGQGNTISLTDDAGNVTDTRKYSAFGEVTESTGTTEFAYQWGGRYGYSLGLSLPVYVRHRHLVAQLSRWTSTDSFDSNDGQNLYMYVHNSPISLIDPSGELSITPGARNLNPTCSTLTASASWTFSITKWPCRGDTGFFIQHVRIHCMICNCNPLAACHHGDLEYWEAWPVSDPGQQPVAKYTPTLSVTDTAGFRPPANGPLGHYRQSGIVKFYCVTPIRQKRIKGEIDRNELSTQPSGNVGGTNPCATTSGNLPRVTKKPSFWDRNPTEGEKGRLFTMYWDCCCSEKWDQANARP